MNINAILTAGLVGSVGIGVSWPRLLFVLFQSTFHRSLPDMSLLTTDNHPRFSPKLAEHIDAVGVEVRASDDKCAIVSRFCSSWGGIYHIS